MTATKQTTESPVTELPMLLYKVQFVGGVDKFYEFPADWKLTYEPVVIPLPVQQRQPNRGRFDEPRFDNNDTSDEVYALRVYETDEKLRVLLTNVVSFQEITRTQSFSVERVNDSKAPQGYREKLIKDNQVENHDNLGTNKESTKSEQDTTLK